MLPISLLAASRKRPEQRTQFCECRPQGCWPVDFAGVLHLAGDIFGFTGNLSIVSTNSSRSDAAALDAVDPLARHRQQFVLPENEIYLDGNSLGVLPKGVKEAVIHSIDHEWGTRLIRSWNEADWFDSPARVGALIAPIIGAHTDEVVACDALSLNVFKCLTAALRLRPGRRTIVSEVGNFPSDSYIVHGVAELFGAKVVDVEAADIPAAIVAAGSDLAAVELTHVNYKTGAVYDMRALTALTHEHGGVTVWDLAHSAGALDVHLNDANADFAAGCGYKYLNGGPGAPGFAFVARRHHPQLSQPITGWFAHKAPFDFTHNFEPIEGIRRMLIGTTPMLSMIALEASMKMWADVDMAALRRKSMAMGDYFIQLVDERLSSYNFGIASPRTAAQRGSQVSLTHEHGYAIMQALIARGVIGDFRAPDILRFGFTPLYVGFVELWDAVDALVNIMETNAWNTPEFTTRKAVT
jgi:kynureninase